MSLSYIIKEGVSGFSRTKLSSFVSVSTITLSLILFGTFLLLSINVQQLVSTLRARMEIETFLDQTIKIEEANKLRDIVFKIEGVRNVLFISKEQAAEIFQKEFGENIFDILDTNPLPPSLKIKIYSDYGSLDSLDKIIPKLRSLPSVTDVKYNREYISLVDKNAKILWMISIGVGLLVGLASIFLVSNTIRLAIYARRFLIQTMKLVGATTSFIRTPFLIEGFLQGLLAGVIADSAIIGLIEVIDANFFAIKRFITISPGFYLTLVLLGALLGFIGSVISVRKFISMRVSD